ncbi:MAG: pantetheine-phosphate adenylyltransferase [Deltaproteobacteria bacterium]|nr:pantetheine-phosphate adenylyltransferase [Deltaproteobacteria bacterium]
MGKIAVYPGSFDPITFGHVDIVERALECFDGVIIAIATDIPKDPLFTLEERVEMAKIALRSKPDVVVESFRGLLVDYVARARATVILRGLRATSDFDYEFHMASTNKSLNQKVETLFMMASKDYFFVSSRTIKEVASLGGSVKGLVPECVERKLKERFDALQKKKQD